MPSGLKATIYRRVGRVPKGAWNQAVTPDHTFMRLPFLHGLEKAWGRQKQIWPVILWDAQRRPQAAICLFGHTIDLAQLGNEAGRDWIHGVRRFYSGFMHVNSLVCGVPVPFGTPGIVLAPWACPEAVVKSLSNLLGKLAWQHWFQSIVIKDLAADGLTRSGLFSDHGFLQSEVSPMSVIRVQHRNLGEWIASLRAHYRYKWNRSLQKFEDSGHTCSQYVGAAILPHYDRRTHSLYASLAKRQQLGFERMSYSFFRELVRVHGNQVRLTALRHPQGRIVGFCWSLLHRGIYQNLLCGFDSRTNRQHDLYFNLAIRDMAYGMQSGAREIWLGQTTEEFKARLGAVSVARYAHIRSIAPVTSALRVLSPWVLPKREKFAPRSIYRCNEESSRRRTATAMAIPETMQKPLESSGVSIPD